MDTYDKCPKKYHFRYIEKPDIEEQKHSATELGSCAHKLLELFHGEINNGSIDLEQYPSLMKKCFVTAVKEFDLALLEEKTWTPDGDKIGLAHLREIMQSYLDKIRKEGLPKVIGIEEPFHFNLDERSSVRGFIDRVDDMGDGVYRVVDYKTTKDAKYLSGFQLLVYAKALRVKYPDLKKVLGSYIMLKHNCKNIDFEYSLYDIEECEKKLLKKALSIHGEEVWVKKPSLLCNWCDYKGLCQDTWIEEKE